MLLLTHFLKNVVPNVTQINIVCNKRICSFNALLPFRKGQRLFWILLLKEEQEMTCNVKNLRKLCSRNQRQTGFIDPKHGLYISLKILNGLKTEILQLRSCRV